MQPLLFEKKKADGVNIQGVNETYFSVKKVELLSGRKLTPSDYSNFSRVVLLDEGLAQQLFGTENPLNQVVSVGDNNYRVVGIFKDPNAGTALYGASLRWKCLDGQYPTRPLNSERMKFKILSSMCQM